MMDVIKKNLVSIIFALVAIAAVVLLFWPISGYYTKLNGEVAARKSAYETLSGLNTKSRDFPSLDLQAGSETKKLEVFPTENVITVGKTMVEQLKKQRQAVWQAALKMNEHSLLEPGSLPDAGNAALVNFGLKYKTVMDITTADGRKNSTLLQIMHGGFQPTKDEITAKRAEIEKEITEKTLYAGGVALNEAQITQEKKDRLPYVADNLRQERAEKCQVYVEPTAFDPYRDLIAFNQAAPDPSQVYMAQLGLWVHEDVARSIATANEGAKNVMDAPVKHLTKIQLPAEMFRFQGGQPKQENNPALPVTKVYTATPSGRVVNGLYDVVRFRLSMMVDAEQLPLVLQALSRDKFMTVLWVSRMEVVDSAFMKTLGFYYGDRPIVSLELQCEDIFLRAWTYQYMPQQVKNGLGAAAVTLPDPEPVSK